MELKDMVAQVVESMRKHINSAVAPLVERIAKFEKTLSELPVPKDGKDGAPGVDGKNGSDGLNGKDGAPGVDGKNGSDGLNGKDADPALIARLVNESVEKLLPLMIEKALEIKTPDIVAKSVALMPKPVDGRDGRDGAPGKDGKDGIGMLGEKGIDGKNGADGFSPDDLSLEALDGGRAIRISLKIGERVVSRETTLAIPLDRGVYKSGMEAKAGDGVTYAGSFWIAQRDTTTMPGKSDDWRLAVKRGQDGKDLRT